MTAKTLKNIFVHCSDSAFGEVRIIESWHKQRGWKSIGYHYVILNGRPFKDVRYIDFLDGQIQPGHALNDDPIFQDFEVGTHVAGRNASSIGVCLIGTHEFTDAQLLATRRLILSLLKKFQLQVADVLGHYEDPDANKTCPNIPMEYFREFLKDAIPLCELQQHMQRYVTALRLV
jgi:N-acetylmuramoyl-L-alanine amidase